MTAGAWRSQDQGQGLAKRPGDGIELELDVGQQAMQFIFKPGFSTATKVTSVSGRGVGMDVVKTNIEKIGGTVDLQSVEGKGSGFLSRFRLRWRLCPRLSSNAGRALCHTADLRG